MRDSKRSFAKMAMHALLSRPTSSAYTPAEIAAKAWAIADAMDAEDVERRTVELTRPRAHEGDGS